MASDAHARFETFPRSARCSRVWADPGCGCTGLDVNASVWGTADGNSFVVCYNGLDHRMAKTSTGSGFNATEWAPLLGRGWGSGASDYFVVTVSVGSAGAPNLHRPVGCQPRTSTPLG